MSDKLRPVSSNKRKALEIAIEAQGVVDGSLSEAEVVHVCHNYSKCTFLL